jgi:hypothetical protein
VFRDLKAVVVEYTDDENLTRQFVGVETAYRLTDDADTVEFVAVATRLYVECVAVVGAVDRGDRQTEP